MKINDQTKVLR